MIKPNSRFFTEIFYYLQVFLSLMFFSLPVIFYMGLEAVAKGEPILIGLYLAVLLSLPGLLPMYSIFLAMDAKLEVKNLNYFSYIFTAYRKFFKRGLLISALGTSIVAILLVDLKVVPTAAKLVFLLLIVLVLAIFENMIYFMVAYDYSFKDSLVRSKILTLDNLFTNISYEVFFLLVFINLLESVK